MPGLSAWAVRRPVLALVAWVVALLGVVGLGLGAGGSFNDSFDLPDTESSRAMQLLDSAGIDSGSFGGAATIVWSGTGDAKAMDPAVMESVAPALESIASLGSVACVTNPAGASFGRDCPPSPGAASPSDAASDPAAMQAKVAAFVRTLSAESQAAFGQLAPPVQAFFAMMPAEQQATVAKMPAEQLGTIGQAFGEAQTANLPISPDQRVAYASVTFAGNGAEVTVEDAKAILQTVKELNGGSVVAGAQGSMLEFAGQEPPASEGIGLIVAIVILLIAFGSIVAAGLPIVVALVGLTMGQMLVLFTARFLDVATFAPTLAAMIGLGVGIDYALFVMNRYRQALLAGHEPKRAAMEAVETSGRAVLFAGSTVIIALLGLWVLRINFFNGLSIAAAAVVLMVMLAAVWLLPALLSLMGNKALALRLPWGKKPGTAHPEGRAWAHYGRLLQRAPWLTGALATALVLVLAIPVLSLRQGFADDSGKPEGSSSRIAYDLRSDGFGPGVNGPFLVAVKLPKAGDIEGYTAIVEGLAATEGVARTQPSVGTLPIVPLMPERFGLDKDVAVVGVIPTTSPQDVATTDLLDRLRTEVNPALEEATGAQIYVGGTQAITSDFTTMLGDALPVFLLVVVGLGFLALLLLFHSIVVPLTAAITSLMSFAAALGITVAVFQWGWLNDLLGIPGTGPIFPFLPIMVFAILFGLSMDYQVFLVSRMHEEYVRTGDNAASVRRGLAGSGRVVVIAAAIMASVFAAFIPSTNSMIKLFGVALASAVIIDAFIVRMVIVPSAMLLFGRANWWLPGWLDRILPTVHIEPGEDEITDDDPRDELALAKVD